MAKCRLNIIQGRAVAKAIVLASLAAFSAPAMADVESGAIAWGEGNWDAAVKEWREPAAQGDPDALFNMGQAYRLGRGVDQDTARAEAQYRLAAQGGHLRAADTYGLMLFQSGRKQAALPYIQDAARRGDPRSQYLLGLAYFNADMVAKDWVKAYAFVSLANAQGLPQAAPALNQMDQHIPLDQRQQAASLALKMEGEASAARALELAAADLAMRTPQAAAIPASSPVAVAGPAPGDITPIASAGNNIPRPIEQADIAAPAAAQAPAPMASDMGRLAVAQSAVDDVTRVRGTESPAQAGADYARPATQPAPLSTRPPAPVRVSSPVRPSAPPKAPSQPVAPARVAAVSPDSGPWKIQFGAFSARENAEKLWSSLSSRPEVAGRKRLLVAAGKLTKLQAGGYTSRALAANACQRLQQSGQACFVTR